MTQLTDGQKREAEARLLQNYCTEAVALMLGIPQNSVLGVWANLKRCGRVAKEVKPGQIPGMARQPDFRNPYTSANQPTAPAYPSQPVQPSWNIQYPALAQSPPARPPAQPASGAPADAASTPTTLAEASLLRKILYNPKNMIWFDWFRNKHPFDGDFADFVEDCIEDFFRRRGLQIIIRRNGSGPR